MIVIVLQNSQGQGLYFITLVSPPHSTMFGVWLVLSNYLNGWAQGWMDGWLAGRKEGEMVCYLDVLIESLF